VGFPVFCLFLPLTQLRNTHALLSKDPKYGGFQFYSTVTSTFVAKIPDTLDFNSASVLPLAISTAASALFQSNNLDLPLPSLFPASTNKITVIWGGSSSVGALAIQLAKAAGLTVITTASAKNHDFVKSLGADFMFDYNDRLVISDISTAINTARKTFVGVVDCISAPESLDMCYSVLRKSHATKKIVSLLPVDDVPEDVDLAYAMAFTIISDQHKHIGEAIWGDYVPRALAEGKLKAVPEAMVVGRGLEAIQGALAIQENGVSAKKVVIEL
jgi:D-arabinose 1-dehydrogenase-like Zn-dependent alcohol dehydrogenase